MTINLDYFRKWRASHGKSVKASNRKYREANKEKRNAANKHWRQKHKTERAVYMLEYQRKRRLADPLFRLKQNLRTRLNRAVKKQFKSGSAIKNLGCSIEQLTKHLESKFQPGMTWNNWGRNGWHIDHIRPLSSFDLTDPIQMSEACHFTNLQPLWARDNIIKGGK